MNFDDAIKAHTTWKAKLSSYLFKPDHTLTASVVASPNECELGKWLQGEGKKYSNTPEFTALVAGHSRFHKAAAEVVKKADSGQCVTEEIALGGKSEFATASAAVVRSIMEMKAHLSR